jgi:hypothetical protein
MLDILIIHLLVKPSDESKGEKLTHVNLILGTWLLQ